MVPQNPPFSFDMYPHFFDGAKKRRYPPKKRFPTPAVCSRKRCPLHKGTKALHRKNGGSDSRPPSFRPTAVFILHLPPGYFWLNLTGWDWHPSVRVADTSPQGEVNGSAECGGKAPLVKGGCLRSRRGDSLQIESGKLKAENAGADIIRPFKKRCLRRNTSSGTSCHLLLSRRRQTPLSAAQTSPLTGESPQGEGFHSHHHCNQKRR